ncbi:hypothetical protein MKW98_018052, partial [Papaver atlanticum]
YAKRWYFELPPPTPPFNSTGAKRTLTEFFFWFSVTATTTIRSFVWFSELQEENIVVLRRGRTTTKKGKRCTKNKSAEDTGTMYTKGFSRIDTIKQVN